MVKKYKVVLAYTLLLWSMSAAAEEDIHPVADRPSESATLIIFRPRSSPPLAFSPSVSVHKKGAARLAPGQHVKLQVMPGTYEVSTRWSNKWQGVKDVQTSVTVDATKTAYVRITNSLNFPISGHSNSELQNVELPNLSKSTTAKIFPGWYLQNDILPAGVKSPYVGVSIATRILEGTTMVQTSTARQVVRLRLKREEILEALNTKLLSVYQDPLETREQLDAAVWMCRALAQSSNEKYLDTLHRLRDESLNKKLRRYSKKFIRKYYK